MIALLYACGSPIRQDELDCEEAVARLDGCCPRFDASGISCVHGTVSQGCDAREIVPDIDGTESQCIRSESCAELQSTGVCQRAQRSSTEEFTALRACP